MILDVLFNNGRVSEIYRRESIARLEQVLNTLFLLRDDASPWTLKNVAVNLYKERSYNKTFPCFKAVEDIRRNNELGHEEERKVQNIDRYVFT
jgi:hypothetical protein